jgi:hypothetical protein
MSRLAATVCLSAVLACATACASSAPAGAEQQVRALERAWLDAYEQRDPSAMERILADDFTITYPNAAVQTKRDVVDYIVRERDAHNVPPHFFTESTVAHVYPGTVILSGLVVTERVRDGQTVRSTQRYTDTYVYVHGQWQVAASHLSNVPKP